MNPQPHPRLLFAADASGKRDTGLGRHQWHLARDLERRGYHVTEFYAEHVPAKGPQSLRRFQFPWALLRQVRRAARTQDPYDVVIVHEGSAGLLCMGRRLGLTAAPCIVVSHNPEQKVWERNLEFARRGLNSVPFRSRIFWPLTRLWQSNLALRWADCVICLSEEDRSFIQERYKVRPEQILLLHNGVGEEFFLEPSVEAAPRILFLGTWLPHKGIQALVSALARVLAEHGNATASLCGVGQDEGAVLACFTERLRARIQVQAYVSPTDLPKVMAAHNIFVLPSWFEGMPLSLLEAMAAGLAVVVTEVGGMRDVVRAGVDGLVVPAHDPDRLAEALDSLCRDSDLRARMGKAAKKRVAPYSWQHAGEILAKAIHLALEANSRQACRSSEQVGA